MQAIDKKCFYALSLNAIKANYGQIDLGLLERSVHARNYWDVWLTLK